MATTVSLKPNAVEISGSTSGTTTLQATAVAGTTTLTLPAATDTLVGRATTDTLTNKTLTGAAMNGTVGATTPSTGAFTTVNASDGTNGNIKSYVDVTAGYLQSLNQAANAYRPLLLMGSTVSFANNGITSATIDSSGRLIIGNTTMPVGYGTALNVYTTGVGARVYGTAEANGPFWVDKQTNTSSTSQVFIQFTINTQVTGNGQINGNGASQVAFGSFSDSRLKENINDLPPQLANIMALRPVEFDYIESEGGGHQTSFIAQEFEEIYPDAIGERPDGMKTLTGWGKTEARLVKAIQEQQALITTLTARITALESA